MNEQVITIIQGVSRKKGFLGLRRDNYTLVITNQRLLFAMISKNVLALYKQDMAEQHQKNKIEGKGFFSSWGSSIATGLSWYNRYLDMTAEEILAESKENFFLQRSDILSVKAHEFLGMNDDDQDTSLPSFTIKTREKKYKFLINRGYDPAQLKMLQEWSRLP